MGGTQAVTVRQADGTVDSFGCWTNVLKWAFTNVEFFKSPKHLNDFIDEWKNNNDLYRHPHLSPSEYGIIVVDYQTKNIVYCSTYTTLGRFNLVNIFTDYQSYGLEAFEDPDSDELFRLWQFIRAGLVTSVERFDPILKWHHSEEDTALAKLLQTPADFVKMFKLELSWRECVDDNDARLIVSLGDFTITKYNWNELTALQTKIKELGFTLTAEEEQQWADAITHQDSLDD